jgi:hypothetical protein
MSKSSFGYMDLLKRVEIEATADPNVVDAIRITSMNPLLDDLLTQAGKNPSNAEEFERKIRAASGSTACTY